MEERVDLISVGTNVREEGARIRVIIMAEI